MAKSGQDVKIEAYEKRLYDMVMADVDPKQPFKAQQEQADSIMTRLLGPKWKQEEGKDDSAYINKLDEAGDQYDLGRAPEAAAPLDAENHGVTGILTTLRDLLNKMVP